MDKVYFSVFGFGDDFVREGEPRAEFAGKRSSPMKWLVARDQKIECFCCATIFETNCGI